MEAQLTFPQERPRRRMPQGTSPDGGRGFSRQGLLRETAQLTDQDIASYSLLILGTENHLLRRLGIEVEKKDAGFGVIVRKNPLNAREVVVVVLGKTREEIDLGWREVVDCPKISEMLFDQGKLVR